MWAVYTPPRRTPNNGSTRVGVGGLIRQEKGAKKEAPPSRFCGNAVSADAGGPRKERARGASFSCVPREKGARQHARTEQSLPIIKKSQTRTPRNEIEKPSAAAAVYAHEGRSISVKTRTSQAVIGPMSTFQVLLYLPAPPSNTKRCAVIQTSNADTQKHALQTTGAASMKLEVPFFIYEPP